MWFSINLDDIEFLRTPNGCCFAKKEISHIPKRRNNTTDDKYRAGA